MIPIADLKFEIDDEPIDFFKPDQPDGIDEFTPDLPNPIKAARRVIEYVSAWGDGMIDEQEGHPLFARDLVSLAEAVASAAERDLGLTPEITRRIGRLM
ncbi:hypothetical protein CJ179_38895 [Rhodococcus sp. ACS1]|uniref:hypothetical protein n=1 Tax=Rhodococcus sp. ACS1 TaxID=2028570 RepID=UPI000BB11349|nr:hypothetical protein [Rhodococcus sp. ACS1]PBC38565.1 hypothetical protein CJ179_38895 [Rhodococcus sp. ACS1]